jgi:hypothetical protein
MPITISKNRNVGIVDYNILKKIVRSIIRHLNFPLHSNFRFQTTELGA